MELLSLKDVGCAAVWELKQSEYAVAWNERQRARDRARESGRPVVEEPLTLNPVPVWQRVTGLGTESEWRLRPQERRGALLRLARTVERMIRVEWKNALKPQPGTNDRFADGERERDYAPCLYAKRTDLWDPVAEVCHYLEIAQSKLSDLLRQATGLRARDLSDCVRVESLRADLKERMRAATRKWLNHQFNTTDYRPLAQLAAPEGQAIVLREYRASETFRDRTELATAYGLGSRARLYRAVRICEGMALEKLEQRVAMEVFLETIGEIWTSCELSKEEIVPLRRALRPVLEEYGYLVKDEEDTSGD